MKKRNIVRVFLLCISFFILISPAAISLSKSMQAYQISQYQINVNILKDGSLDISEQVDFSFLGNSNNAVLLIDKQEGEEIEIKGIYIYSKNKWVEFEQLNYGEWGANVFNGTYSEIQESNLVRLKVYGIFKKQQAKILVRYNVKNAITRYKDIAVYNRRHVQKYWEGYISELSIRINPPKQIDTKKVKSYLHGLLVGETQVLDGGGISYIIPNTVPGEYVEARVVFPEYLFEDVEIESDIAYLNILLEEEKAYLENDKSDLLKARENAAKEEGKRASDERQRRNLQVFSRIISFLASLLGVITIYRINKVMKTPELKSVFTVKDIPTLNAAEACLLYRNKTGARALIAGLLQLSSKGLVKLSQKGGNICFYTPEHQAKGHLKGSDVKLLELLASLLNEEGYLCLNEFEDIIYKVQNSEKAHSVIRLYNKWDRAVKREHLHNNELTPEQLYNRNIGLIMGVILFGAGCIISVAASIWAGYLMIPIGLLLFYQAYRVEMKTAYSFSRIKALNDLIDIFKNDKQSSHDSPNWICDKALVMSFAIALGVENGLFLLMDLTEPINALDTFFAEGLEDKLQ